MVKPEQSCVNKAQFGWTQGFTKAGKKLPWRTSERDEWHGSLRWYLLLMGSLEVAGPNECFDWFVVAMHLCHIHVRREMARSRQPIDLGVASCG